MKNRKINDEQFENQPLTLSEEVKVANSAPVVGWANFEVFWHKVVKKNASATVKSACKEHLISLGVWEDQSKWIDAVKDFGIALE